MILPLYVTLFYICPFLTLNRNGRTLKRCRKNFSQIWGVSTSAVMYMCEVDSELRKDLQALILLTFQGVDKNTTGNLFKMLF